MSTFFKLKFFISFFAICTTCLYSQVELPNVFADNMVLQQKTRVSIWGKDTPNTAVEIKSSWGTMAKAISDSNGHWSTSIKTKKASFKSHSLTIKGSNSVTLKNILIGEVWFCSGQSNMEMPMKGLGKSKVENAESYLKKADNKYVRLFNNPRTASVQPRFQMNGSWAESKYESAESFSAIGFMFASRLFNELKIPIGIIESSWGGTKIETWIPREKLSKYQSIKFSDTLSDDQNKQKKPSFLYNAMIHPFQDFTIRGILWYQGEGNRNDPEPYKNYMKDLIESWRMQWNNNQLPFYLVQIAPYAYEKHKNTPKIKANLIRESQVEIVKEVPNTGVVITTDAGDCDDIHPSKKEIVAIRLANWALAKQYQFGNLDYKSPEFKSMTIKGNQVIVSFEFFNKDRFISTDLVGGFELAGEDKVFYPVEGKIGTKGKTILLQSSDVQKPIAVRYGFVDCFEGNLGTKSGLPISVFRTDKW